MGESLKYFETWAKATFPRAFKQMKDYLEEQHLSASFYDHVGCRSRGPLIRTRGVIVGETPNAAPVYATISKYNYSTKLRVPVDSREFTTVNFTTVSSSDNLRFKEPFNWLLHQDENADFEFSALIAHMLSVRFGSFDQLLQDDTFRAGFKYACDIIMRKLAEQGRAAGSFNHCILLKYGTNRAANISQTDLNSDLVERASHKQTSNEVNAYATLSHNLNQLRAAQAADRHQKDELLPTNTHTLKRKLIDMEQECERYKASLTTSEAKAKLEVESARLESLRAQQQARAARKENEAAKHEAEQVRQETHRMKQEVEQLKQQVGLGQKSKGEWEELKKAFQTFQSNVDMQT